MSLLDEAMAGVIGGEGGDPLTVAQMSCMTMVVCCSCFDLERATQWVQSLERFIDRYGCPFLYAECRTYYGRVLFENGDRAPPRRFSPRRSRCRGAFSRRARFCVRDARRTQARAGAARGRGQGAARRQRREEAAARSPRCISYRGEPSAAAAVLRPRLAATNPDRLDVAAVIELLGEAEIALLDSGAAIEQ
jgi:hypothetical protein